MAKVARSTTIPIATGERLTTKQEFSQVLKLNAANILQPALGRVGGIWEAKKIAILAETYNSSLAPHLYAGPLEWAANIQLGASIPNLLILETIKTGKGFQRELITKDIIWEDGFIFPSNEPGLGIELNESVAKKNPYKLNDLHLEMSTKSVDY
jgi:L-alanine-DL-glutamate epimerase-like enolase superfamily enzyme